MEKDKFADIIRDFETALQWIKSLGIKIEGTRVEQLHKDLKSFSSQIVIPAQFIDQDDFKAQFYSFNEAYDFIRIHKAYSNYTSPTFIEKLGKAVLGPRAGAKQTVRNVEARNYLTELAWGAILENSGYTTSFEEGFDVFQHITYGKYGSLAWEVKRPLKINGLGYRAKKGANQLREKLSGKISIANTTPLGGCLLIKIDLLIMDNNYYIEGENEYASREYVKRAIQEWYREHEDFFDSCWKKKVLGIVFWWNTVGTIPNIFGKKRITNIDQTYYRDNPNERSKNKRTIMEEIFKSIKG